MSSMEINCKYCNKVVKVRTADVKRGWGKFCNKSCKAKEQIKTKPYYSNEYKYVDGHPLDSGISGHGQN